MTTTNPIELESITLCLQGRRDCYEPLVKKYQGNVMALAMNMTGNYDDARDIMQETFVRAYVNLHRFDRERSFKTWLLSIAMKRCLDHFRKQKSILNYFLKHSEDFQEQRERAYSGNKTLEESEIFFPLLKRLKQRERAALVLKINEGYSAREVGQVLGCSENTARVHLFNAKQQLKKWLSLPQNQKVSNAVKEVSI